MPISATEIDAWQRVHRVHLSPWELDMIAAFDGVYMEVVAKRQQQEKE